MLNSLYIKNYRNLKELKINSVEQVNLITGKNNTGKSAILESIAIYAGRGRISLICQLLSNRGDYFFNKSKDMVEPTTRSLSAMFTDRVVDFSEKGAIVIGNMIEGSKSSGKNVKIKFVKFSKNILKTEQGEVIHIPKIHNGNNGTNNGLEISFENNKTLIPLDEGLFYPHIGIHDYFIQQNCQLVYPAKTDNEVNGKHFDNIALTEKEKYVIDALKIIEPAVERIAFIEDNNERIAVVKLSNVSGTLPLRSMGDGMNRILATILALVNSDNGFLLLDEFENGLHYTIQKKLWEIIFELSKCLNVQVFATTHSSDCITAFQSVLNSSDNITKGKLIRLDNMNGFIKTVDYSARELKIATEQQIETR